MQEPWSLKHRFDKLDMGDIIEIRPYDGKILSETGEVLSEFTFKSDVILDEVQAGGPY